jgi:hypothetical protein
VLLLLLQLSDYKAGSCRADLEESRAAARAQQGLEPDSDEVRRGAQALRLSCSFFGLQPFAVLCDLQPAWVCPVLLISWELVLALHMRSFRIRTGSTVEAPWFLINGCFIFENGCHICKMRPWRLIHASHSLSRFLTAVCCAGASASLCMRT